jgi:hypothetical protein
MLVRIALFIVLSGVAAMPTEAGATKGRGRGGYFLAGKIVAPGQVPTTGAARLADWTSRHGGGLAATAALTEVMRGRSWQRFFGRWFDTVNRVPGNAIGPSRSSC